MTSRTKPHTMTSQPIPSEAIHRDRLAQPSTVLMAQKINCKLHSFIAGHLNFLISL
jgi:hypothetical protein